jgi:transcriptional regulator with XRE-family HTH domain
MSAPSKPTRVQLGRAISELREQAGLTQQRLGEETGLGQTAVSRIETGDRRVDTLELVDIARALGVTVSEILDRAPVANGNEDGAQLLALRVGDHDPDATSLAWVNQFLKDFDRLERLRDE